MTKFLNGNSLQKVRFLQALTISLTLTEFYSTSYGLYMLPMKRGTFKLESIRDSSQRNIILHTIRIPLHHPVLSEHAS